MRHVYLLSSKEGGRLGTVAVAYVWRRRSDALWWASALEDIHGAFYSRGELLSGSLFNAQEDRLVVLIARKGEAGILDSRYGSLINQ